MSRKQNMVEELGSELWAVIEEWGEEYNYSPSTVVDSGITELALQVADEIYGDSDDYVEDEQPSGDMDNYNHNQGFYNE